MSNNITSIVNSTTAIITAGSNFTGKAEDISNYNTIVAHVIADQDVLIEIFQSEDGTNWDIYSNGTASATSIKVLLVPAQAKYCYVKITNNTASDTTYCRLQTIFKESCQSVFLDSSIQNLVLNTRAIKDTEDGILCFGYDGSSNQKIKTSNGGLIRNLPEYNIQSFLLNNRLHLHIKKWI